MTTGEPFAAVVRQRSQLGRAMQQVELAAAAPAARESWTIDLQNALRQLEVAFNDHVVEVQSPSALLDRIVDEAPRLQRAVEATKEDHITIAKSITSVIDMLAGDGAGQNHDEIRDAVLAVLLALSRHRQKGADLIHDAYAVDIGGY